MKRLLLPVLALALLAGCNGEGSGLSDAGLKQLISEAACWPMRSDADNADVQTGLSMPKCPNQPLTYLLLLQYGRNEPYHGENPRSALVPAARKEFYVETNDRGKLNRALLPGRKTEGAQRLSFIRPEVITKCTRTRRDDVITGTVSFRVPGAYHGRAGYTVRRRGGTWRVEEFRLPARGYRTVLTPQGLWTSAPWRKDVRPPTVPLPASEDRDDLRSCRVVFVLPTRRESSPATTRAARGGKTIHVAVRRSYGAEVEYVYEVEGHNRAIRGIRKFRAVLKALAAKADAAKEPLVLMREGADASWEGVVGTLATARVAGYKRVGIDGIDGAIKLDWGVRRGNCDRIEQDEDRMVVNVISAGRDRKNPILRSTAAYYQILNTCISKDDADFVRRLIASRLAEAGKAGRKELQIEIWSDREVDWSYIESLLTKLPDPPRRPVRLSDYPRAPSKARLAKNAHHIVWVIDRSGSMMDTLELVKREVAASLGQLKASQDFHVILFSDGPAIEIETKRLVPATNKAKLKAVTFLRDKRALGQADPIPALKRAFAVLAGAEAKKPGKLINLMTDGAFPDNEQVVALLRKLNKDKSVIVNTYLYADRSPAAVSVMKQIAKENNGRCFFVSNEE